MAEEIFSGDGSEDLWDDIKRIKKRKTRMAVYSLGCRCQELETLVRKLRGRVEQLEATKKEGEK